MRIIVQYSEGEDLSTHWRKQITLPKAWHKSKCDRLKRFLVENYNKAFDALPPLSPEEWHLSNERDGSCASLGTEDVISEVIGPLDQIFLRPGASTECSGWRRPDIRPTGVAAAQVLVPLEHEALLALRAAVDADNTEALKEAVEKASVSSPHEMLMAEVDVKDEDGRVCGTEWHSTGGRFAWDTEAEGRGEDPSKKVTLTEYARQRGAGRVLKLVELADHCGAPVLGGSRVRSSEDIEASAGSVAEQMEEMNSQLKTSLQSRAAA